MRAPAASSIVIGLTFLLFIICGMVAVLVVNVHPELCFWTVCDVRAWSGRFVPIDHTTIMVDGRAFYWLDDNTLVFVGAEKDSKLKRFPGERARIQLWRLGEKPIPYGTDVWPPKGSGLLTGYLCAERGNIYYATSQAETLPNYGGTKVNILAGPPGQERSAIHTNRPASVGASWRNPMTTVGGACEQYLEPAMAGHIWAVSYFHDATLDFGRINAHAMLGEPLDTPLRLLRIPGLEEIPVKDVDPRWVKGLCTLPLTWEHSFVVWRCPQGSQNMLSITSLPVWKIHMDGTSERFDLYVGDLWGVELIPSRGGYYAIVSGTKGPHGSTWPEAGIYKAAKDGKLIQLAKGHFTHAKVSPNGCHAAFSEALEFWLLGADERLAVFDLCGMERN